MICVKSFAYRQELPNGDDAVNEVSGEDEEGGASTKLRRLASIPVGINPLYGGDEYRSSFPGRELDEPAAHNGFAQDSYALSSDACLWTFGA